MGIFKPASRTKSKLRAAIAGPSGSGKTFTALRAAFALGKKVCMIATEPGAAEKYVGLAPDGVQWNFDICTLDDYSPSTYRSAVVAAGQERYDVCVIDSLSHEWEGTGGALELVDKKASAGRGNKFTDGWGQVTPMHRALFEAIVRSPCHVIATVRTKTEYSLEKNEHGKAVPVKLGMKPVQREGVEYEFDVFGRMDLTHTLSIEKTRCPNIDGLVAVKPGAETFAPLVSWLNEGSEPPEGYYTANEYDLQLSAAAREEEQAAAEKAKAKAGKKTAAEVKAEQEGKGKEANAAPAPQAKPVGKPATSSSSSSTPTQEEIDRLKAEAEAKMAGAKASEARLLEGNQQEKEKREVAGGNGKESAAAGDFATRQQAMEVIDLFKQLNLDKAKMVSILSKAGVEKASQLKRADCNTLIESLRKAMKKREAAASAAAKQSTAKDRQPGDEKPGDTRDTPPATGTDEIPFG
ncbi:MAG: ATP-binding protein [Planctomycetaceae bacterium]